MGPEVVGTTEGFLGVVVGTPVLGLGLGEPGVTVGGLVTGPELGEPRVTVGQRCYWGNRKDFQELCWAHLWLDCCWENLVSQWEDW